MRHREEHRLKQRASIFFGVLIWVSLVLGLGGARESSALELDWSGQFSAESNSVWNYTMDNSGSFTADPTRAAANGYYISPGGSKDTTFQNIFLRLRPKLVVNDNLYIKSEWWLGNPIFGLFGSALPYSSDQNQFYSSQSRGSAITAQRFWGEFVTDIGTIQVGRVPLHWGLGLVWNAGDSPRSRYMSTGDAIRWVAKFGAFSFIPSFIVNSAGNTIGGSCSVNSSGTCVSGVGVGGVTDYSLILKYENVEDEFELGLNLIRRIGGSGQDPTYGVLAPQSGLPEQSATLNFTTFDFYARKKLNRFTLAAEVPIITGQLGSSGFQTFGLATEVNWKTSDSVEMIVKGGYASGQPNLGASTIDNFRAFYFNTNYKIAMIMFNYQLFNFYKPQTLNSPSLSQNQLGSPYDNPIVNAIYLSAGSQIKPWDKWTLKPVLTYAQAPQVAGSSGFFYNYWTKSQQSSNGQSQGSGLGWEFDLGLTFQWDEYFQFSFDNGVFFPGSFYAFSNTAVSNVTQPVFATSVSVSINF